MKRKVRDDWVAELRNGRRHQGRGRLRQDAVTVTFWCCLGVLADILARDRWQCSPTGGDWSVDGNSAYLSDELLARAGLSDWQQRMLARMNDDGFTFEELASLIERFTVGDVPSHGVDEALALAASPAALWMAKALVIPPKWLSKSESPDKEVVAQS